MLPLIIDSEKLLDILKFDSYNPLLFNTGLFLILFMLFITV